MVRYAPHSVVLEDHPETATHPKCDTIGSYYPHVIPLLCEMQWLPLCFWVDFKLLAFPLKLFFPWGQVTQVSLLSCFYISHHVWWEGLLHLMGQREQVFSVTTSELWDIVPLKIRLALTLMTFHKTPKMWMCSRVWNLGVSWPVPRDHFADCFGFVLGVDSLCFMDILKHCFMSCPESHLWHGQLYKSNK